MEGKYYAKKKSKFKKSDDTGNSFERRKKPDVYGDLQDTYPGGVQCEPLQIAEYVVELIYNP